VHPRQLPLAILREDQGFILYRCEASSRPGSASVLLRTPSSSKSFIGTLNEIEQEYSVKNEGVSVEALKPGGRETGGISREHGKYADALC
jgi:hypothetical protein